MGLDVLRRRSAVVEKKMDEKKEKGKIPRRKQNLQTDWSGTRKGAGESLVFTGILAYAALAPKSSLPCKLANGLSI